jgi:hypothetical protein
MVKRFTKTDIRLRLKPVVYYVEHSDYDRLATLARELAITYLNDSETAEAILKELDHGPS